MSERRPYCPRGATIKPCHGCGSTTPHRPDSVCDDCKARFRKLADLEAAQAAGTIDRQPYRCTDYAHHLPYIHSCAGGSREDQNRLQEAFYALAQAMSTPSADHAYSVPAERVVWPYTRQDRGDGVRVTRMFVPGQPEALRAVYQAVRDAIPRARAAGHQEGRQLLAQLAAGRITMDALNDCATRAEEAL